MYKTNWGIGHGLKDILEAHKGPFTGQGHKGLYEILTMSGHAQLSLNLAMLGSLTIVVAHHMYSMPPYPYLATNYGVLFAYKYLLIPDKANLGFRFPCDGPGRGGTCQVSAWDHVFLELFWMYNSISVVIFHFSYKMQLDIWVSVQNPLYVRPIAHAIWDPHFGQPAVEAFTRGGALGPVNIAYSGVYQWWYTIGLRTNQDLYIGTLFLLFLSAISLIAGLFGVSSLAWTGHLVHVAIPTSRGEYVRWNNFLDVLLHPQGLGPLYTGQWNLYAQNPNSSSHLFGTAQGAGTAILTLLEGFHPQTQSLWLTDIAHHYLAITFIFLIAGHIYRTNFGIRHSIKDLLDAHTTPGGLGRGHKGLYDTINNSLHFQLGLALASLGVITSLVAQHNYSLLAYAFIEQDFTTQAALYTPHQYIAGFIMTGAFAHGAIFFIRDYNPEQNEDNVLARMLDNKEAIISHLSWASLFLGFHPLGLYVHYDVMLAFGTLEKQILTEPMFAQ
ncbi:Photosystem I chlorophyll a apoprotein A2 [Capsicum annuum]|uniref:photosystem I n=1 Tax=Capsicum annuum TaxID=4072 RepID=A0A2G2XXX6_CAPAN|nr:Photosystem I chlorophyll a apoprotein A2 [Capsicum annuum]